MQMLCSESFLPRTRKEMLHRGSRSGAICLHSLRKMSCWYTVKTRTLGLPRALSASRPSTLECSTARSVRLRWCDESPYTSLTLQFTCRENKAEAREPGGTRPVPSSPARDTPPHPTPPPPPFSTSPRPHCKMEIYYLPRQLPGWMDDLTRC